MCLEPLPHWGAWRGQVQREAGVWSESEPAFSWLSSSHSLAASTPHPQSGRGRPLLNRAVPRQRHREPAKHHTTPQVATGHFQHPQCSRCKAAPQAHSPTTQAPPPAGQVRPEFQAAQARAPLPHVKAKSTPSWPLPSKPFSDPSHLGLQGVLYVCQPAAADKRRDSMHRFLRLQDIRPKGPQGNKGEDSVPAFTLAESITAPPPRKLLSAPKASWFSGAIELLCTEQEAANPPRQHTSEGAFLRRPSSPTW